MSGTSDAEGKFILTKTKLFWLRVLDPIRSFQVYDDFALVIFPDETVYIAVRPQVEGELAEYSVVATDVGETKRGFLDFKDTPIQYHSVVSDSSLTYDYILNIITLGRDGLRYLSQWGIEIDTVENSVFFE